MLPFQTEAVSREPAQGAPPCPVALISDEHATCADKQQDMIGCRTGVYSQDLTRQCRARPTAAFHPIRLILRWRPSSNRLGSFAQQVEVAFIGKDAPARLSGDFFDNAEIQ